MKKILRLVTTSALALGLVACGEATECPTCPTCETCKTCETCPTCPTTGESYAAVSSIAIAADSSVLEQLSNSLKKVTVNATLNANVDPATEIEWYVDGVKSAQTSKAFEFQPTSTGEFKIQAKVGNVKSNEIVVKVSAPSTGAVEISAIKYIDSKTLEVSSEQGSEVKVSLNGKEVELSSNSYYDIADEKYILKLATAIAQGDEIKVTVKKDAKEGSLSLTYDTRELAIKSATGFTTLVPVDGIYYIYKPFEDAGAVLAQYTFGLESTNCLKATGNTSFKVETEVPAGASAIKASESLITADASMDTTFNVTKNTVPGLYTHKFTLGGKSIDVKVMVLEPEATIALNPAYNLVYDDSTTAAAEYYAVKYDEAVYDGYGELKLDTAKHTGVVANADGSYTVTKPYASSGYNSVLSFEVTGRYFDKLEYGQSNYYSVSLTGPSNQIAGIVNLTDGMETNADGSSNKANGISITDGSTGGTTVGSKTFVVGNEINNAAFAAQYDEFGSPTTNTKVITQVITPDTPAGKYTFTFKMGPMGQEKSFDVVINVEEPKASLTGKLEGLGFIEGTRNGEYVTVTNYAARQLDYEFDAATNTYTITKPKFEGEEKYQYKLWFDLMNYESEKASEAEILAEEVKVYNYPVIESSLFKASEVIALASETTGDSGTLKAQDVPDAPKTYEETIKALNIRGTVVTPALTIEGIDDLINTTRVSGETAYRKWTNYSFVEDGPGVTTDNKVYKMALVLGNSEPGIRFANALTYDINKATVPGTYTYTMTIDGLTSTVTVVVKEAEAKLFVLSGANATAIKHASGLHFEKATADGTAADQANYLLSSAFVTTTGAQTATDNLTGSEGAPVVTNTSYEFIKLVAVGGSAAGTTYIAPAADGEYYIDLAQLGTTSNTLDATLNLADFTPVSTVEYAYSVSKSYPEIEKDTKANGLVVLNSAGEKAHGYLGTANFKDVQSSGFAFNDAFKIHETSLTMGDYEYNFEFNGLKKTIKVHVGYSLPTLKVERMTIGATQLTKIGSTFTYEHPSNVSAATVNVVLSGVNLDAYAGNLWISTKETLTSSTILNNAELTAVKFDENGEFAYYVDQFTYPTEPQAIEKKVVNATKLYLYTRNPLAATTAKKLAEIQPSYFVVTVDATTGKVTN